jgi:hypothetical protein
MYGAMRGQMTAIGALVGNLVQDSGENLPELA